ncbi:hypothetical protein [Pseudoalteromonas luteoviolacea]|uniref:Uncharacterized protein n=1 Tax=Pseudoalteromonas luteoviolacea H33 TaxID=1365251 RepID=A0A167EAE9_9GAMM|nr:hypothetical protein [Pseudoalteromonas luteoviolacea]KZN50310.1 hypothetical protein N476_02140 [Pseudoalteromonas luteoviolacea H33]KZN73112.1 hypothetical protein N477_02625 [Pseudoalteromonas luteoviolacea H33-S]
MLNAPPCIAVNYGQSIQKIERKASGKVLATLKQKSPIIEMTGL